MDDGRTRTPQSHAGRRDTAQDFAANTDASLEHIRAAFADRFAVTRELGSGASSHVYLAVDLSTEHPVAIKVLRDELASAVSGARFVREIQIGQQLRHPRIVPILASGSVNGRLFYTMPVIEGQSLSERLARVRVLSLDDAITIATHVAEALDYAHANGVIHRDIKPGNVLLGNGGAVVADFGVARAVTLAAGESLTDSGMAIGTPAYMSPEQAGGEREIDGRADVYALGCVLYEMLAGEPPFTGPTAQAIIARHFQEVPRSLRIVRPTVPTGMQRAIERALAKVPIDRFATAGELMREIAAHRDDAVTATGSQAGSLRRARSRWVMRGVGVGIVAAVVVGLTLRGETTWWRSGVTGRALGAVGLIEPSLDTTLFAVIGPKEEDVGDIAVGIGAGDNLMNAMRAAAVQWREIRVADPLAIAQANSRFPARQLTVEQERVVASAAGAGRYVSVRTNRVADSIHVNVTLFDTRAGRQLASATARVATLPKQLDSLAAAQWDSLLFHDIAPIVARDAGVRSTQSIQARSTFLQGHRALEDGRFAAADSMFFTATRTDPAYADALVWLALMRSWLPTADRPWQQTVDQISRVTAQGATLTVPNRQILRALTAQAALRFDVACDVWTQLTNTDAHDFSTWYGLGACLRHDRGVVRDRASRTGWSFRASYERAMRAYERAFRLRPAILRGRGEQSLADLQSLFFTRVARFREGTAVPPDTLQFTSQAEWSHDTLAFFPVFDPQSVSIAVPAAAAASVQFQRARLHKITQIWRAEFPRSAEAAEAVAVSLEGLGDARALDTLRLARGLAESPSARLRIAAEEVFLRVKFALPNDPVSLKVARQLADSILERHEPSATSEPVLLSALAALVGRAHLSAAHANAAVAERLPPAIAQSGPALLAYAAMGGPADSLAVFELRVSKGIDALPAAQQMSQRTRWLMRPGTLAFPEHRLASLATFDIPRFRTANLVGAATRGDTATVRSILRGLTTLRGSTRAADITIDGLFPEGSALAEIGDPAGAIGWLDPTLSALRHSTSHELALPAHAGPLLRSAVLRATLADRVGDAATARTWAKAVLTLWSGADEFLQPTVRRMERLAR